MTYPFYTRDARDLAAGGGAAAPGPDHPGGYLPDPGLVDAVNVALLLGRPLLLTGEPGTGKTQLAYSVAWQLAGRKLLNLTSTRVEKFETKSSSLAKDLFYSFDTIGRFQAAHGGGHANHLDYLSFNALGRAILNALPRPEVASLIPERFPHNGPARSVVLIDEIDKAPRDFPNDLLNEIEHMYFKIPELSHAVVGGPGKLADGLKPIVIITSNSERNLPDPFLRRCIYYDIPFPSETELKEILLSRLQRLTSRDDRLVTDALDFFLKLREENIPRRKISPAELIQWLLFLLERGADRRAKLREAAAIALEGLGALTKDPADQQRVRAELKLYLGMP